jgi:hypothetical protein
MSHCCASSSPDWYVPAPVFLVGKGKSGNTIWTAAFAVGTVDGGSSKNCRRFVRLNGYHLSNTGEIKYNLWEGCTVWIRMKFCWT